MLCGPLKPRFSDDSLFLLAEGKFRLEHYVNILIALQDAI